VTRPAANSGGARLALLNTSMPSDSFQARDLFALGRLGAAVDLYVLDPRSISPELRAALESGGGSVRRLASPFSAAALAALVRALFTQPGRLLGSVAIALRVMSRDFEEGARSIGMLGPALAVGRRMAAEGTVQVHGLWAGVPTTTAYWIHRHYGLPFSFSGHAYDLHYQTTLLPAKVSEACAAVVCSEFALRKLAALLPAEHRDRIRLVHHGLDLGEWSHAGRTTADPTAPRVILAVGRLTEKKGYRYLVEACGRLRDQGVLGECHIIGPDFGEGAELTRGLRDLGLEHQVRLLGKISNAEVRERMSRASVLAVPSMEDKHGDSDGVPNVVLEAMALGLPVVSTHAGGLAEAVVDGRTGFVVPQKDAEALAAALRRVLMEECDLVTLRRSARELIEREFRVENNARLFLEAIGRPLHGVAPVEIAARSTLRSGALVPGEC